MAEEENIFLQFPRPTATYHTKAYAAISPTRPELSMKGKTVLVTGGASGIGLETSKAFAQAGASVLVIVSRTEATLQAAKKDIESTYPNTHVKIYAGSVSDSARMNAVVKEIGSIDVLMLNAATMHVPAPILDISEADLMENFATNVAGPVNLVKAFIDLKPRDQQHGRTIILTSTAGIQAPFPGTSVYCASKNAVTFMMRAFYQEFASAGLRVFAFHPAIAFTPMTRDIMGHTEDDFQYDKLDLPASYAVWLASKESDFLNGRYTWSHWDVEELKAKKDLIQSDPNQLTIGLVVDKVLHVSK